ncbi:nucleoside hydrolase [Basidiobolus meristosporus CBS 931.73]|uniref:Nucleoside hydrolase n=1 Tax=Basidiobolus meristosporus CBS 931.73 TaxID=1314790 RepID=A0A1Y1VWF0_9FUNG|nr:nucleoside hydrolase [Basidiobolus meristosporus CBS 931.73]ORY04227.1 nucleoside hydrolase [Basidiobolus meristosporus CBS 931.73]|eukprot:ORX65074.1 nucleoside hydrolase [Basidiobolus meristosporus CBS 931.73]
MSIPQPSKLIIDTDPGIDDTLAIAYAITSPNLEILACTLTHGNTCLENSSKNLVALLKVMEEERLHRQKTGLGVFEKQVPVIALGAEKPMKCEPFSAEYFHGQDGLGNIHESMPDLAPEEWKHIWFKKAAEKSDEMAVNLGEDPQHLPKYYQATRRNAVDEILHQLKSNPPFTVSIVALGPLTNIALALQKDRVTMGRAKQICIMGGAVDVPGNVTAVAEFNFYADPHAAAIVMNASRGFHPDIHRKYQEVETTLPIHIRLFPTDLTGSVSLSSKTIQDPIGTLRTPAGAFFAQLLQHPASNMKAKFNWDSIQLHDPSCMAGFVDITNDALVEGGWVSKWLDIRVEDEGHITRGMCVRDRRFWSKSMQEGVASSVVEDGTNQADPSNWTVSLNRVEVFMECDVKRVAGLLIQRTLGCNIHA